MSAPGGDGPKFLGAPPAAPPPKAAAPGAPPPPRSPTPPPTPPGDDDIHQQIMDAFLVGKMQRVQRAQEWWAGPRWAATGGWRGAWVEQRFAGLSTRVPGTWRHAPETGGVLWDLPGGGFAKIFMWGFEKRVPPIEEWFRLMGDDDDNKLTRIGPPRTIDHPHRDAPRGAAGELGAHSFIGTDWAIRWSCHALWSANALLTFSMVTNGPPTADQAADFVAVWRGLR